MARLYYEKKFKIGAMAAPAPQNNIALDEYLTKVAQLVPSEIIVGYVALTSFIVQSKNADVLIWCIFGLCLVLTPFYLNRTAVPSLPKRNHLILSTVAFAVWAFATSGFALMKALNLEFEPEIASLVLIAFSMVSGLIPLDK